MSKYNYISPIKRGYTKLKVSKKTHNELLPNIRIGWSDKFEYYYNNDEIIIHNYTSTLGFIATILLLPINLLLYGFSEIKDMMNELYRISNPKRTGRFVESVIHKKYNDVLYEHLIESSKVIQLIS